MKIGQDQDRAKDHGQVKQKKMTSFNKINLRVLEQEQCRDNLPYQEE